MRESNGAVQEIHTNKSLVIYKQPEQEPQEKEYIKFDDDGNSYLTESIIFTYDSEKGSFKIEQIIRKHDSKP